MKSHRHGPMTTAVLAVLVLLLAVVLDHGSPGSRDAALILGSIGLYVLLPVAALWAFLALAVRRRNKP